MSKIQIDRQTAKQIVVALTPKEVGAGNEVTAKLPMGALITGVRLIATTAFNSAGGTPTITATVKDDATTFVNAQSLATVGDKTVAVGFKYLPQGGELTFSLAETATTKATEGHALAVVEYVIEGAGCGIYG